MQPGVITDLVSSIRIQPRYGFKQADVLWTPLQFARGDVFVFRSKTGVGEWTLVNETSVPLQNGGLTDDQLIVGDLTEKTHWRLLVDVDGLLIQSQPIMIFDFLQPDEKAGCMGLIEHEFWRMRQNGIPALFYLPKYSGTPAAGTNPQTSSSANFDCPDVAEEDDSFGMPFVGGFQAPIHTFLELYQIGPRNLMKTPSGAADGIDWKQARIPCWPSPRTDAMIVLPHTDDRYIFDEQFNTYAFRGTYPVAHDVKVKLLPRNDPRYRLRAPSPLPVK